MEVWSEDAAKKVENRKSRVKKKRVCKGLIKQTIQSISFDLTVVIVLLTKT